MFQAKFPEKFGGPTIERDDRRLATQLADQIADLMKERDKVLIGMVMEADRQRQAGINQAKSQATATNQ